GELEISQNNFCLKGSSSSLQTSGDTNEVSRGQKAIETESDPTDDGCLPLLQDEVLLN
ncbi:hypothetical protein CEXT_95671, partial [Caerostris extrusa]